MNFNKKKIRVIDLTHMVATAMPVWPGDPPTLIEPVARIDREKYALNRLSIAEHSGTHAGAPRHFMESGADISAIPASQLFLPAVKINVRTLATEKDDFLVQPEQIDRWEKQFGRIGEGEMVIIETGWSDFWDQPARYFCSHFPGISIETAGLLMSERRVAAVGIDSAGLDGGACLEFTANKLVAAGGALHVENLTNLAQVPERGAWIFLGALPICGGTGSPARVLALVPDS